MTANLKLSFLDRLHTLVVVASGAAVGLITMRLLSAPWVEPFSGPAFAILAAALVSGYLTMHAVDGMVTAVVRPLRFRLMALDDADRFAAAPARIED